MLRSAPLGEADRLLTLFTPDLGRLRTSARGVRKTTSKLGGHLDPLTRSSLTITRGQSLDTVTGADTIETFLGVKSDLSLLARALYLAEVLEAFNPLEAPNPPVYALFIDGLRALALGTHPDPDLVVRFVELHVLRHTGFLPELERCVECRGQILPNQHTLSPAAGGVLCPSCGAARTDAMPLSVDSLKLLRYLASSPLPAALLVNVRPALHREVAAILNSVLRHTLERELRSAAFLRSVKLAQSQSGVAAATARN